MSDRRAPIDRLVDLAVAIPTCTFVAAKRAVPLAARVSTLGVARFVGRLSEAVHELRDGDVGPSEDVAASIDVVDLDHDQRLETVTVDELPIDGYDDLAARQVVDRLGALGRADLGRVETYEREHRNRSTVLGKISMLTA